MPLTAAEVLQLSRAARLGIDHAEAAELAHALAPVLERVEELLLVETGGVNPVDGIGAAGMPLRPDRGPPIAMTGVPDRFAPRWRQGLFVLPLVTPEPIAPQRPERPLPPGSSDS